MASGKVKVGLSGWSYRGWRGDFYPKGLRQKDELAYAAGLFPTLEVNGTFYSLSTPKAMRSWYETAPSGFTFALKGSRFITHNKKLGDVDEAMANFMASGVLELRDKLGPIVWQLSPKIRFDAVARLAQKATLDRAHSTRLLGENHRVRHAIEPRHESFFGEEMVSLCRRHGVAIAFSHSSVWPYTEEVTAGFIYLRLHGPRRLYSSPYTMAELEGWAEKIQAWATGDEPEDALRLTDRSPPRRKTRDVYVYFDNDSGGHAPRNARQLIEILGQG